MSSHPPQSAIQDQFQREELPPAIISLASFPRFGNTLLRIILSSCFGQLSHSIYSDTEFDDSAIRHVLGHEAIGPEATSGISDNRIAMPVRDKCHAADQHQGGMRN